MQTISNAIEFFHASTYPDTDFLMGQPVTLKEVKQAKYAIGKVFGGFETYKVVDIKPFKERMFLVEINDSKEREWGSFDFLLHLSGEAIDFTIIKETRTEDFAYLCEFDDGTRQWIRE